MDRDSSANSPDYTDFSYDSLNSAKPSGEPLSSNSSDTLDLKMALKISQAISSEIELKPLLQKLMKFVIESAGAERGTLVLIENKELVIGAQTNVDEEDVMVLHNLPIELSDDVPAPIINYVYRTSESLLLNNVANKGLFVGSSYIIRVRPLSVLCTPLIHQSKMLGIFYLENNLIAGAFTEKRIEILDLIASQISISLNNARLFKELKELTETLEHRVMERTQELEVLAATDPLTGASNRRFFMEAAESELSRVRLENEPLSVLMLDADHFKAVNDSHGHATGDQVLIKLVQICREELREIDVLGRLGGEEFAMLLINSDLAAAQEVSERIRKHIETTDIPLENGILNFTVSIGACELKPDDLNFDALLARTDRAVYEAKDSGRNRVVSG